MTGSSARRTSSITITGPPAGPSAGGPAPLLLRMLAKTEPAYRPPRLSLIRLIQNKEPGREALCRPERARDPRPRDLERGGGQPHLSQLRRRPARKIPGIGESLRRDGRRGGAASHPAVRP